MRIKEGFLLFIAFVIIVFFNFNIVSASLGLTPAIIRTDFKPYDKFLINFNVIGADANQKLEVYASGDLSQYVRFDKVTLKGEDSFTSYIDLPGEIAKPGQHVVYIRVREIKDSLEGIGTRLEIGAALVIKVPYPGKYAEIKTFYVNNTNAGEPVIFYSEVENLGKENLVLKPIINVYSNNKKVDEFLLEKRDINHTTLEKFVKIVENGYGVGVYNASISFDYGEIINKSTYFKVGSLFVNIVNWSSKFIKGKINEFNIEIENNWNNDVKDVYAEVNVTHKNIQADFFKTPSIELRKWDKSVLKGFFNCENLEKGIYQANISLFYEDKKTEKVVDIEVSNPPFSNNLIIAIGLGLFLFFILIGALIYLILNRKTSKRYKK